MIKVSFPKSDCYHITASEKSAIKQGLQSGLTQFKTARKEYKVIREIGNMKDIEISCKETDFFNRPTVKKHIVTAITA